MEPSPLLDLTCQIHQYFAGTFPKLQHLPKEHQTGYYYFGGSSSRQRRASMVSLAIEIRYYRHLRALRQSRKKGPVTEVTVVVSLQLILVVYYVVPIRAF